MSTVNRLESEFRFEPAQKNNEKLNMAIIGPKGAGKTRTALAIGAAFIKHYGGKMAIIDTEYGRSRKFADLYAFDILELRAPFDPRRYTQAMQAAAAGGYSVIIVDGFSQAWDGPGGLLESVDRYAAQIPSHNTFFAWSKANPIHQEMIRTMLSLDAHFIGTMRSKMTYVVDEIKADGRIRTVPRKIGLQPIQRDNFEYEFEHIIEMRLPSHELVVVSSMCDGLDEQVIDKPTGQEVADILIPWLEGGESAKRPAAQAMTSALVPIDPDEWWDTLVHNAQRLGYESEEDVLRTLQARAYPQERIVEREVGRMMALLRIAREDGGH